jgi:hypothetical protein
MRGGLMPALKTGLPSLVNWSAMQHNFDGDDSYWTQYEGLHWGTHQPLRKLTPRF